MDQESTLESDDMSTTVLDFLKGRLGIPLCSHSQLNESGALKIELGIQICPRGGSVSQSVSHATGRNKAIAANSPVSGPHQE